jgi:formylglycine-generating enzyme required for sulfatase activity
MVVTSLIAVLLAGSAVLADSPECLQGASLWLDASSIAQDAGQIAEWRDISGGCLNAVQSEPERRPTRNVNQTSGVSTLRLDGNDFMTLPLKRDWSGGDWTLFVVASLDSNVSPGYRGIIGDRFGDGNANWWSLGTKGDGLSYLELGAGVGVSTSFSPANSLLCVYAVERKGKEMRFYKNGAFLGAAEQANVGGISNELRIGMWFGDEQTWRGEVGEIILREGAMADPERESVEGWLCDKWKVFQAGRVMKKEADWPTSMLSSRAAFMDWAAKNAPGVPSGLLDAEMWGAMKTAFPVESGRFERLAAAAGRVPSEWFLKDADCEFEKTLISAGGNGFADELKALVASNAAVSDARWLTLAAKAGETRDAFLASLRRLEDFNPAALRRAIYDLTKTHPDKYVNGPEFSARLNELERILPDVKTGLAACDPAALKASEEILKLQKDALLANPLLDFDKLLFIRRSVGSPSLGLVQNWQSNCTLPREGFDNDIAQLSPVSPDGAVTTIYKPEKPVFVGDVDLNFDADRMLFSSIGALDRWQIFEVGVDGKNLRQVTPGDEPDVDDYDPCYLPDGRIMFCSNAYFTAVPCVNGTTRCASLYRMESDGSGIRQLCFDQEHNWCPTMLPNGRVLYLRWEYTDTPHTHDRVLFHMNPDGTNQSEYYGSNSYWPNSLFYARPVPGSSTKFVGIVSGHHGVPRMGELVLFDIARGRRECSGAIQRIPGWGKKIEWGDDFRRDSPLIADNLVDNSWPKFLHPYPLSDKYFLASCKPTPNSLWGLYLVDVFDNMLLLREEPEQALFEPVPLRKTERPPLIPDSVKPERDDAVVYLADVYSGGGLRGIPKGEVKSLRLFTYHFLYPGMGGPQAVVGMEGPWDMRRTLGTVPVEPDGSAYFRVPANTPISVQPLDGEGKALQLMRSWFTGMRGETVSCVGCHESQNSTPPQKRGAALDREPSEIAYWHGQQRGYNFDRELQPTLDKYCAGCHDGNSDIPNFKERAHITDYTSVFHNGGVDAGHFSVSYANLHRYVRRPGLESDYHMLTPMEFHSDSTELVQILSKGHHNVHLDADSWDRLITWIDFNAPFNGTWTEIAGKDRVEYPSTRRRELLKKYAGMDSAPEAIPTTEEPPVAFVKPDETLVASPVLECPGWPFSSDDAKRKQSECGDVEKTVDLGSGLTLTFKRIPAGDFVMGAADGLNDERPANVVHIDKPFWIGECEITNAQFELFDSTHDSAVESRFSMQFGVRGFYVNGPEQPVVRVSWTDAMAFCKWLSDKTGWRFTLPTEAQWEYACRAGTSTQFFYGDMNADWSQYANLADAKLREFVCHTYKKEREPWFAASKYDDWIPKDTRFDDGGFLSDGVGRYLPNAWGLRDMIGNVCEWTRSSYRPYPYVESDGRNGEEIKERKVVRGGSWRDRPSRTGSAYRLAYRAYQPVFNVGFRVVIEEPF